MGSGDVVGVNVDGLHGTGRTIAGRSSGGGAAARQLKSGLDSASGSVGHSRVSSALTTFVTSNVLDPSNQLSHQLTNAGDNVSNVASVARSRDEEGARSLQDTVGGSSETSDRINRNIPL